MIELWIPLSCSIHESVRGSGLRVTEKVVGLLTESDNRPGTKMQSEPNLTTVSRCPCCEHGTLLPAFRDETIDVADDGEVKTVEVKDVPIERCSACGEEFSGPDAAHVKHLAICRAIALLSPLEIRQFREQMNLTQIEFARLTGIGEATISRWERGRLLQNRGHDRYLRLLMHDPGNIDQLRRMQTGVAAQRSQLLERHYRNPSPVSDLSERFPDLGGDAKVCEGMAQAFELFPLSTAGSMPLTF